MEQIQRVNCVQNIVYTKTSLTWEEKKIVIFLFSIIGTISKPEIWKTFVVSEEFMKLADNIANDTRKLASMLNIADPLFDELAKEIGKGIFKVECMHHTELEEHKNKVKKSPITIRREYLDNLLEITLTKCKNCTNNAKRCGLRTVLKKLNIIAVDPEKTEHPCEYHYK